MNFTKTNQGTLFELTNLYTTIGINKLIENNEIEMEDIMVMALRHTLNDDDNKYEEDREYNLKNIKECGRVLNVYKFKDYNIYINSYIQPSPFDEEKRISVETVAMLSEEY